MAELLKVPSVEQDSVAALWAFWFNHLRIARKTSDIGWDLLFNSLIIGLIVGTPGTAPRLVRNVLKVAEVILGKDATSPRMDQVVEQLGTCVGVDSGRLHRSRAGAAAAVEYPPDHREALMYWTLDPFDRSTIGCSRAFIESKSIVT